MYLVLFPILKDKMIAQVELFESDYESLGYSTMNMEGRSRDNLVLHRRRFVFLFNSLATAFSALSILSFLFSSSLKIKAELVRNTKRLLSPFSILPFFLSSLP